jgi:hypothetical protein
MRSWICLLLASMALGLGALLPALGWADEPAPVSCDGFPISYAGGAKQRQCLVANVADGIQTMQTHQLMVVDRAFFLLVNYIESGYKTYLPEHKLDEIVEDSRLFAGTADWLTPQSIQGIDVAVFSGMLKGRQYPDVCAIFSRYSGNPGNDYDSSFGPAFKNHVVGYYCVVPASLAVEQRGEGFYSVVQGVIAQLRLPPVE